MRGPGHMPLLKQRGEWRHQVEVDCFQMLHANGDHNKHSFAASFAQTTKWKDDQLIVISAFWDAALQARQLGLAM